MPQDKTEFANELQNIISEALAAGIAEEDIVEALESAAAQLDSGEANDGGDDET